MIQRKQAGTDGRMRTDSPAPRSGGIDRRDARGAGVSPGRGGILALAAGGVLATVMATAMAAEATPAPPTPTYDSCMALARSRPDKALDEAGRWRGLGGGAAARHCEAVALLGLGKAAEAGRRLEALAQEGGLAPGLVVDLLAQAGQAWGMAGDLSRAEAVQTAAVQAIGNRPDLAGRTADLLIDRAITRAGAGRDDDALADLSRVLGQEPGRVEALVLRAAARRRLGNLPGALADAEDAVRRAPTDEEARLVRGDCFLSLGDPNQARADWLAVLSLAPDSPAAATARGRIAALDVGRDP